MAEKNGNGGAKMVGQIFMWIFAVVVFPSLFFIGNNVIANDKDSRARDYKIVEKVEKIEHDLYGEIRNMRVEQTQRHENLMSKHSEMSNAITRIATILESR